MIKIFDKVEDIDIYLRNQIIKQTLLPSKFVLNGVNLNGSDLNYYDNGKLIPFNRDVDTFIVFYLEESNTDDNNVSMTEEDEYVLLYTPFTFNCHIYGKDATVVAHRIKSLMKTEKVINDLLVNGIYLHDISNISATNENINNVIWTRRDISLNIAVVLKFEQVDNYENYESTNLTIIK